MTEDVTSLAIRLDNAERIAEKATKVAAKLRTTWAKWCEDHDIHVHAIHITQVERHESVSVAADTEGR